MAPLATDLTRAGLIAAVRQERRAVDLDGCALHEGWENVVLATRDGWILRFPRTEQHDFARELAILGVVSSKLPAATPTVEWTGSRTRFAAYRTLTGVPLRVEVYDQAPAAERDRVAASLAEVLAAMHGMFKPRQVANLGIPDLDHADLLGPVEQHLATVEPSLRMALQEARDSFADRWVRPVQADAVVLHNDYHLHNLVLDAPLGKVSGLWDFSCVAVGEPSFDFRYLAGDSTDLAERTAGHYTEQTGRPVDLDAAALAIRFEDLSDAIVEGRPIEPVLADW